LPFAFDTAPPPKITGVSPPAGSAGTFAAISGSTSRMGMKVFFGDQEATILELFSQEVSVLAPDGTGTVDVRVVTDMGEDTLVGGITYPGPPEIDSVSPASGVAGTTITIGKHVYSDAVVEVGGKPCGGWIASTTVIYSDVPDGNGTVDVKVTTSLGFDSELNAFTYETTQLRRSRPWSPTAARPEIGSRSPAPASTRRPAPGSATTSAKTEFEDESPLVCLVPPGSGTVDVKVEHGNGEDTKPAAFAYQSTPVPVPSIGGVAPATGAAGTKITITGTGFQSGSTVTVGGQPCRGDNGFVRRSSCPPTTG
jgi:hypothetical protein